jgi:hypothetical protein
VLAFGADANSDDTDWLFGDEPGMLAFKFGVIPTGDKERFLALASHVDEVRN